MKRQAKLRARGFTLIEMVVVISLMLVLLAIALPMYNRAILRGKEATLHADLKTLNGVVQEYSQNKHKAPQTLDDLVQQGYLKFIPNDITGSNTTWQTDPEEQDKAWDPSQPGIAWVRSGSNEMASDGSGPYSSWTH